MRVGDRVIYEEHNWACPRTGERYARLTLSATKNKNLRIDLWKHIKAHLNGKIPSISTLLPQEAAKQYLELSDFDLQKVARDYLFVNADGNSIKVRKNIVSLVQPILFAYPHGGDLENDIVQVKRPEGSVTCMDQGEDFENKYWITVQLHADLFQISSTQNKCRLLKNSQDGSGLFSILEKRPLFESRKCFAACSLAGDRHVFVSGGLSNQSFEILASVERYDTVSGSWEPMPSLNVSRFRHASCSMVDTVYIFCGQAGNRKYTNSIEKLSRSGAAQTATALWQVIDLLSSALTPRIQPAVCKLNGSQIAILGGQDSNHELLGDVYTFDVKRRTTEKTSEGLDGLVFSADGN